MSQQLAQTRQGRTMRESRFDGVEMRQLKASDQVGVSARRVHDPMVAPAKTETEGNRPENQTATDGNLVDVAFPSTLVSAVSLALARCGISHKEAAGLMGLTPGQWSKQLSGSDGHHVQLDRLAMLPERFHVEFARLYGESVGLAIAHEHVAALLIGRVGQLLVEANALYSQLRALGRTA